MGVLAVGFLLLRQLICFVQRDLITMDGVLGLQLTGLAFLRCDCGGALSETEVNGVVEQELLLVLES